MLLQYSLLIVLGCASFVVPECGNPAIKPDTTRIVGGKETKPNSWPWMAVLFKKPIIGPFYHFCDGTLVAPDWVMTAGHCFYGEKDVKKFKILLGAHYKNKVEPTQFEAFISEIHVNPAYNTTGGGATSDITLLKLAQPVQFTDYISPICLPAKDATVPPDDTRGFATGWGVTRAGGQTSPMLLQVDVPVVNHQKCIDEWAVEQAKVDDTEICGGYDQGGKGVCNGDSGGPWVFQSPEGIWTQHGIVSWGYPCAHAHYPDVYGRVTAFKDFIDKTMGTL